MAEVPKIRGNNLPHKFLAFCLIALKVLWSSRVPLDYRDHLGDKSRCVMIFKLLLDNASCRPKVNRGLPAGNNLIFI